MEILSQIPSATGRLASVQLELAISQRNRGLHRSALATFRQAAQLAATAHGPNHPSTAHAQTELAGALIAQGELSEAETLLNDAHNALRAKLPAEHLDFVVVHAVQGDLERARGRPQRARAAYEHAIELLLQAKLPVDHYRIAEIEARLK